MSQNGPFTGPPWSSGGKDPDKPYTEPADPWAEQAPGPGLPEPPEWGSHPPSIPQQPVSYHSAPIAGGGAGSAMWNQPSAPPKRNTPIIALVVTLAVLVAVGLGTVWVLKERNDRTKQQAQPVPSATTDGGVPVPQGSEDARFSAKQGDCVINDGTPEKPEMRTTACTSGALEVLKRLDGRTTGVKDAEGKCAKVKGYTKWYFYDSAFDELDFVLCLKDHK